MDHKFEIDALGYSSGCQVWMNASATSPQIYKGLQSYSRDLDQYNAAIRDFQPIPDLLETIKRTGNHDICATARPHPDGIKALFTSSNQLSLSKSGFLEPLTPPMRSQKICDRMDKNLMSLDYLVHDFEAMCRTLKPTSKRILIDMGASLSFHSNSQPIIALMNQYEKFGFRFDHIYAFEVKPTKPEEAYNMIPEKYMPSYHWINVGVTHTKGHKLNPLHSIVKQFHEDDFVVVKLDIDTSWIEVPLAKELLEDEDGVYHKLVDQFYFEHHVKLKELKAHWKGGAKGSVKSSMELFSGLRQKGIPAHFWP
jgi:hypothetical protein